MHDYIQIQSFKCRCKYTCIKKYLNVCIWVALLIDNTCVEKVQLCPYLSSQDILETLEGAGKALDQDDKNETACPSRQTETKHFSKRSQHSLTWQVMEASVSTTSTLISVPWVLHGMLLMHFICVKVFCAMVHAVSFACHRKERFSNVQALYVQWSIP